MSEHVNSDDIKDTSIEQSSLCDNETSRTQFSYIRSGNKVLNAERIADQELSYRGLDPSDEHE